MPYVIAVSKNLIITDKISRIAGSLGFDSCAMCSGEAIKKAKSSSPDLIIVDLEENPQFVQQLKSSGINVQVLCFYPHIKIQLKESAEKSGYPCKIVPNSLMEKSLREFLTQLANM